MSKISVSKGSSTPTGSTIARQPLGGCEYSSQRADSGIKSSHISHQPICSKSSNITQIPVWISTTSRPAASGFNTVCPRGRRTLSPPQPPPLPPPPPSPQLVPLKARLARSKSIAARPVSNRPDYGQRLRKASDGGAPTRFTNPSSVRTRSTSEIRPQKEVKEVSTGDVETSEANQSVSTVNPSAFLPIAHPTERSPVYVCLASVAFLGVSLLVTSIFSTIFLPFCLIASLIRRTGIWLANVFQYTTCCQCGGFLISNNTNPVIETIISRLSVGSNSGQRCHCYAEAQLDNRNSESLIALSSAELRWLPVLEYKYEHEWNGKNGATLYCSSQSPSVIICLRFGAPGLKLSRLRDLISSRLLTRPSNCSSLASSPRGSCLTDRGYSDINRKRRESSYIPPSDTRSRLTQCLTYLSTGYAWRECLAFQLEEHVVRVPSFISVKSEINPDKYSSRSYGTKFDDKQSTHTKLINVEVLLNELSALPLRLDRPLWKAHLMEQFCESDDTTEPSDIESDADSDESNTCKTFQSSREPLNNIGKDGSTKLNKPKNCVANKYNNTYNKRGVNPFVCRRSGSSGIGSLLVFQFHAALSDDGKALVHMLTNCLADLPSRTQTPQYTPNKQTPIHTTSSTNDPVDDKIPEVPSPLDHKKKWRGHKSVSMDCDITTSNNNNISNAVSHLQSASSSLSKDDSASPKLNVSAKSSVSSGNSNPFHYSCESAKTVLTSERKFQSNVTSSSANRDQLTSSNSYRNQKPKPDQNEAVSGVSTNSSHFNVTSPLDDEDPEESEAAQWWYTFWASSLATIATVCDLLRVVVTGPAIIFHKYFLTSADMGLYTKHNNTQSFKSSAKSSSAVQSSTNNNNGDNGQDEKIIHKCALLSLAKLSRLRQITKASYSELILSLLAGALRAYHQTMGFKHPPDLLAFLATEVPVLPSCDFGTSSISITNCNNSSDTPCSTFTRVLSTTQRVRSSNLAIHNISSWRLQKQTQQLQHDSNTVETGLLGNTNRMVAIGSPPTTIRSLCPGRNVLAEFCLPINTEGMLPRLWETKQRLNELNTSVDPLCLAWARTVLYTLMPHSVAKWIESTYGGPAKASVTVTGVEVVSPFTTSSSAKNTDSSCSYQMPKARRLAYMSLLASKSSDARILRQRLRKRLPRGAAVYPPRLGTSFRALARHLVNANAGIIYVAGCPIIRIDTWMPSPNHIPSELVTHPQSTTLQDRTFKHAVVHICRDLSVTFTTYAGQLSLTFSASSKQCIHPNLDLILSAIKSQINKMCQLLSGRHVPNMTSRWLRHSSSVESSVSALSAISMSPSLNPSLVLHNEIASSDGQSNKNISPAKTPSKISSSSQADALILPTKVNISHFETPLEITSQYSDTTSNSLESNPYADKPMYPTSSHDATKSFYAYQAGQPIEQLQAQLRWVQRQLEEASSPKNITESSATSNNMRLAKLRSEFCILLRQLKQRCSQGELGIESSVNDLNEIKDVSGEFKLNCASLPKSGTSTPQKCSPTTSGYPCLAGQFNVNPFKTEQNSAVKRSTTTGDFDEDPDFYITGQQVDDFEDIDPSEQELAFKEVSDEISNNIFTTIHNTNEVGPMTQYNKQSGVIDHNVGDLHTKQKRQRKSKSKSASGRCRPSKIATEVASLNFMPSRRGSLLAHSTVNGYSKKRSLLVQLMNTVAKSSNVKLLRKE